MRTNPGRGLAAGLCLLGAAVATVSCTSSGPSSPASTVPPSSTQSEPAPPAQGSRLWAQRYGSGTDRPAFAESVAASPDGSRVFVTGSAGTLAYDASTGARMWVHADRTFALSGGSTPPPTVAVSPDGTKVVVAGSSTRRGVSGDYVTIAYDAATGRPVWTARYDGPAHGDDGVRSVVVSPTGNLVFVHGISDGSGSGSDYATVAYDATTGAQKWVSRYNGPGNGTETLFAGGAGSLAVSPDGADVFVTGASADASTGSAPLHDYATVAYSASTGARLWVARYRGAPTSDNYASALTVSPDGRTVLVTGGSAVRSTGLDVATVAYDARTGAQLWAGRYNGPASRNDGAAAIAVDRSGSTVVVTGTSEGAVTGHEDFLTLAYDAAKGTRRWVARYNGPGNLDDNAAALALSNDGATAYVTGRSHGDGSAVDFATVAYRTASGAQQWVARYGSPSGGDDEARSIAVNPKASTVYVTGYAIGGDAPPGYVTIAYRG